jgi:hypothetical protein
MLSAQNRELKTIYSHIDSIIKYERAYFKIPKQAYRMFKISQYYGGYYEPRYEYGKIVYQPLNRKYEKQTLKYLEKFMYDSLKNIRTVVSQLIYSLGLYSKNLKIRQRTVNDLLDMALITNSIAYDVHFFKAEDFDKKAKERLKEIISGKKRKYEIQFNLKDAKISWGNNKILFKEADYLSKKDSLPYKYVKDSLLNEYIKNSDNAFKKDVYGRWFILLTGRLYMYDYIPELEAMLNDERYNKEDRLDIKYALARMGNTKYEDELLKRSDLKYVYIHTQKSAWAYIKKIYENLPDHECYSEYIGLNTVPQSYFIVQYAQTWILNFPDMYKINIDLCAKRYEIKEGKYKEQLEQAKRWFKENKGKYELDPKAW